MTYRVPQKAKPQIKKSPGNIPGLFWLKWILKPLFSLSGKPLWVTSRDV